MPATITEGENDQCNHFFTLLSYTYIYVVVCNTTSNSNKTKKRRGNLKKGMPLFFLYQFQKIGDVIEVGGQGT